MQQTRVSVIKVVITTDLGKDKNLHKLLKIQQVFSKLYHLLCMCVCVCVFII